MVLVVVVIGGGGGGGGASTAHLQSTDKAGALSDCVELVMWVYMWM